MSDPVRDWPAIVARPFPMPDGRGWSIAFERRDDPDVGVDLDDLLVVSEHTARAISESVNDLLSFYETPERRAFDRDRDGA